MLSFPFLLFYPFRFVLSLSLWAVAERVAGFIWICIFHRDFCWHLVNIRFHSFPRSVKQREADCRDNTLPLDCHNSAPGLLVLMTLPSESVKNVRPVSGPEPEIRRQELSMWFATLSQTHCGHLTFPTCREESTFLFLSSFGAELFETTTYFTYTLAWGRRDTAYDTKIRT